MIKVTVKGLSSFNEEFEKAQKRETERMQKAILEDLKEATPVDTGEARAGWYISGDSIRNDVDHIVPLNRGSSQQAPSNFIERTVLARPGVEPNGVIVREG